MKLWLQLVFLWIGTLAACAHVSSTTIWTNQWRGSLELTPGERQLIAEAAHPSGQFTTNATSWFTNSVAHQAATDSFDAGGYLTNRVWRQGTNIVRAQTFSYGGQNGTGGFDAIVPGPELFCPLLSDAHGNIHAVFDQGHSNLVWYPSRVTGYGAVPGYRPVPLGQVGADLGAKYAWRNRAATSIGPTWMGGNWYDPQSGQFIAPDPAGHAGSASLYSFCNGDPIKIWDPDGRLGKPWNGSERQPFYIRLSSITGIPISELLARDFRGGGGGHGYRITAPGPTIGLPSWGDLVNADAIQESWHEVAHPDFGSGWGIAAFGVGLVSLAANTADAVANVFTLGGKGAISSGVKAGVKEISQIGAKKTAEGQLSTIAGEGMDAALFGRMKDAFERQVGRILQGGDVEGYLRAIGAEGRTANARLIQLRVNPSTSAVYEEFIHTAQMRAGRTGTEWIRQNEIDAAEKLIRFRHQYGIPDAETRQTIERLRQLRGDQ